MLRYALSAKINHAGKLRDEETEPRKHHFSFGAPVILSGKHGIAKRVFNTTPTSYLREELKT